MRRKPPLILFLASVGFSHATAVDFLPQVKPLLEKYCIDCHDSTESATDEKDVTWDTAFAVYGKVNKAGK